jgi:hypothetical protein
MIKLPSNSELRNLIKPDKDGGEDTFVERKEGYIAKKMIVASVAFANSVPPNGFGVIFLGVTDDGQIVGLEKHEQVQDKIKDICKNKCYPPVNYSTVVINSGIEKPVLAVIIHDNDFRPYFTGHAYVRRGNSSEKASEEEHKKLIATRNSKVFEINQWDKNQLVTVISKGRKLGPMHTSLGTSTQKIYECLVIECNAHSITFKVMDSQKRYTEPLENIKIAYDDSKYRPMLIVEDSASKSAI